MKLDWVLTMFGSLCLGYYGAAYWDARMSQKEAFEELLQQTVARSAAVRTPDTGSVLGEIEIPRLSLSVMVLEGIDSTTLGRGVGHVPGTALPGEAGNVALAGHRDSFFRPLRDIRNNDQITLRTAEKHYKYTVESTRIVGPEDVEVLEPTGSPILTLVTCYPFSYLGRAPKRLIVQARRDD